MWALGLRKGQVEKPGGKALRPSVREFRVPFGTFSRDLKEN